jgi:hypothetical protein
MRKLLRDGDVRLFSFVQADAYVSRLHTLNKLHLPRGGLDLGADLPPEDVYLVGPTVQLVARDSLHPALSDLLLEAAREVHGRPGTLSQAGRISRRARRRVPHEPDATRYYASGQGLPLPDLSLLAGERWSRGCWPCWCRWCCCSCRP